MLHRLPTALDAQLQRDSHLSFVEYYVLAGLSDQPGHRMRMSDLAILAGLMDQAEVAALSDALTKTMLWPQYAELAGLLVKSGLGPPPALPGGGRPAWRSRAARLRHSASLWTHPLRAAGLLPTHLVRRLPAVRPIHRRPSTRLGSA